MNNAKRFHDVFGIYATELWAMPEKEFLEWLNAKADLSTVRDESFRINKAYDDGCKTGYEQARFDYEQKWIPVTERLPEEDFWYGSEVQTSDFVLITVQGENADNVIVDYGYTRDGVWKSETCDIDIPDSWKVTAWMPLPEPYKGDKE